MALPAYLCCLQHLFAALTNHTLRPQIAALIPGYTPGQMTYDLRRLRRKGLPNHRSGTGVTDGGH
jgi:hypothetical protein